ncbi:MAG TPA: cell division topological specificity factor MinE [Candidatus Mediterraneibacter pullistercoris]|nr:cell division topological specificity factor MinE [Candidatus Mediterraneibacter pullistercoris]
MSVSSVSIAKERLRNLLVSDRIQCTPDAVERLTTDLYHTVSKYMEIEQEDLDIKITRNDIHIRYMGENN